MTASATAILVAGMHRSGTSATAGALARLGIALGDRLLAPGEDNPKGYFENERAVGIHERLLRRLGRRWDDVRELPRDWAAGAAARRARQSIERLVRDEFAGERVWAVKDPRICRFLPLWLETLPQVGVEAVVLMVARKPSEVAGSIARRNGWQPELGYLLWLRHVLEAEAASRNTRRTLITYDSLLAQPDRCLADALRTLGVAVPGLAGGLQSFVEAGQRHVRGGEPPAGRFGRIAERAYDVLCGIAEGSAGWSQLEPVRTAFDEAWRENGHAIAAVAEMAVHASLEGDRLTFRLVHAQSQLRAQLLWSEEAVRRQEDLQRECGDLRSRLAAQIRWSEEAVRKEEALQAQCDGLRSQLAAQIRWSEEAVRKEEALQAECARLRSDLLAQVQWSEEAVRRHSALQAELEETRTTLLREIEEVRTKLSSETEEKVALSLQRDVLEKELARTRASLSWRITAPLRALRRAAANAAVRLGISRDPNQIDKD